ncbi:MAG: tetratricopeptide repeat protein [Anaerolineae bacterium]
MGLLRRLFVDRKRPSLLELAGKDKAKVEAVLSRIPASCRAQVVAFLDKGVQLLESAVEKEPNEWAYWSMLGDFCNRRGYHLEAVRACEKAMELRPNHPLSSYGLATAMRGLTKAKYLWPEHQAERASMAEFYNSAEIPFDPEAAQRALDALGITVDQAAERALLLFEKTLSIGVRQDEEKLVKDTLAAMYAEFPHLEKAVKHARAPVKGLFAEARGPSASGLFNEAADRYRKLRYLYGDEQRFLDELAKIIQLCQLAIDKDEKHGDSYILLANALSLAASRHRFRDESNYEFLISRAAAVIDLWASSPYTGFPSCKNPQIGRTLQQSIFNEIQEWRKLNPEQTQKLVDSYRLEFGYEAISPLSYPEIVATVIGKTQDA